MTITLHVLGDNKTITLDDFHGIVAGYTGRDAAAVQHHIDELAAIGVAPPPEVPMFYPVEAATVNSEASYIDSQNLTSGEIEPVYIRHRGVYYLGVGSDHTDRDLERRDIGDSKRACPKPVSREVIRIGSAEDLAALSLDDTVARCTVDGELYQEGGLSGLRTPSDITERLIARLGLDENDDFICLGGTLPLLGGVFTAGTEWHVEIALTDGARLTAGFASHPEMFAGEEGDDRDYAGNIQRYYEKILRENLYVTYAIIPPQISRATTASGWEGEYLQVGVVRETEEGLIVRGSQMLATGGPVTDEVFVTCIKPLGPDDQDFAISFALPAATPGMKMYCRRPYSTTATSDFDYPLTSRYDEHDVLMVFDDVLVPWDRVFINRNLTALRRQFFETGAHALGNWQAQIRLTTKLKFIAAVARKVTQVNGTDKIPGVQEKLGELAAVVSCVESALIAAQFTAEPDQNGVYIPGRRALYGIMGLQSETYPRAIQILRDLVGGGVMQIPSSVKDLHSEVSRGDVERYVHSPGVPSEERVKLFKLAWGIIGSEFAGRHQQYELFYAGAPFVVKGAYTFRNFGYDELVTELDEFLAGYSSQDSIDALNGEDA